MSNTFEMSFGILRRIFKILIQNYTSSSEVSEIIMTYIQKVVYDLM